MDLNRSPPLSSSSSSSQQSHHFSNNPNNLSSPKDKKPPLSSPSQISDADSHWTNVGVPFPQPGLSSDKNPPFTSPKSIEPPLPFQRGKGKSADLSQFGSRTVDLDHVSGPTQHHQLGFAPNVPGEGTESSADTMVIHPKMVPHIGSISPQLNSKGVEELSQGNPRKRQKASEQNKEGLNCNCVKTQCLQLRCRCFAAGYSCLASCTCKNCFNKRDYEDKVTMEREKIKSRNPDAFTPKIINEGTKSPANTKEDGTVSNPSSSRHITGCSCKSSKCVRRYCVCFRDKVGCALAYCRCNDCQNSFGRRNRNL